jgi:general secretion pathway protein D
MKRRFCDLLGHWLAYCSVLAVIVACGCATSRQAASENALEPSPAQVSAPEVARERVSGEREAERNAVDEGEVSPAAREKDASSPLKREAKPHPLLAAMQAGTPPASIAGEEKPHVHVELAFDNADLYEVLDAALYDLFKVNYVVDPSIKAKVTFHLAGDYTRTQFINMLNEVLQLTNLAIVKGPGSIFKVVRKNKSAAFSTAPLIQDRQADEPGDVTRLIRLRYLAAPMMAQKITPFLSTGTVVLGDTVTNSLVITDTPDNISKVISILAALDVDYLNGISWQIFPLTQVDVNDIAGDLSRMLKAQGTFKPQGTDPGSFDIIPIKSLNALFVATKWPSILNLVENWIAVMDQPGDAEKRVFVYFVENGTAKELADLLQQLYGGRASGTQKKTTIVKPEGKAPERGSYGELLGEVEIIADETNNALVVKASERDYRIIRGVIRELDIVPRQVLINVVIAEIKLSGSAEYGIEWFLRVHRAEYEGQVSLDEKIARSVSAPLGTDKAFTLAVFDGMDFLRGLITALGTDSAVNILFSPNIMAVDHKEASIEVAEEVPLVTSEVTSTEAIATTRTIQYRSTGIVLKVTPHISSTRLVKLELSQEVSEIGEFFPALETNSILTRKADTSLVVEDGQTILIGGLMDSNKTSSSSGVPFLRSIPLLGPLFGGRTEETGKTELIILITPHVVESREEADAITREFAEKVRMVKELVEREEGRRSGTP